MQKGLFFLLVHICMSFAMQSYGCRCLDTRSIEENIKLYAFIAHVKITARTVENDTVREGDKVRVRFDHEADLKFEIVEMFKGDPLAVIKEEGVNSSCEVGIYAGEEWILFAWYNPETQLYSIGGCSPSRRIKNSNGERGTDWAWNQQSGLLTGLQKLFGHPSSEPLYDGGIYRSFYPNGSIEWEAAYTDNQLHGSRKVYFANGVLWKEEHFKNGIIDGLQKTYSRSGQLKNELNYSMGEIIHSAYWYDTSYTERRMRVFAEFMVPRMNIDSVLITRPVTIQKSSEGFNDIKEGLHRSRTYSEKGELTSENFSYNSGAIRVNCRYKDDRLEFEGIYNKTGDHTIEKKWNEKGELISLKEWINGKYMGEQINR
jgi:antitoxin component YwqK of YwqJK toxin-antitoxin module